MAAEISSEYRGPLPPPDHLSQYETILPGLAERIVTVMEKEQGHRHSTQDKSLELETTETLRGQLMAFGIAGILVIGAIVSTILGHQWAATVFIGGASLGFVKSLIDGKKRPQTKE